MVEMISDILFDLQVPSSIQFELVILLRLVSASICGGLIGLERGMKGRPAGIKTFSLVCVGATLAMITNEYISIRTGGGGDLARMAAQVISGIGFLGAGTIIVTGINQIRGLTTAAALWVTAALGIAIGTGFYFGALGGIAVIFLSSLVCNLIDRIIMGKSRIIKLYAEGINEEFMLKLISYFSKENIRVLNLVRRSESKWYKEDTCVMLELDMGKRREHGKILEDIRSLEGLRYVEEV